MFIHLGQEVMIQTEDIIAIIDQEPLLKSKKNVQFMEGHQEAGLIIDLGEQLTKSVVITGDTVYLSPFSTLTLKRRLEADNLG